VAQAVGKSPRRGPGCALAASSARRCISNRKSGPGEPQKSAMPCPSGSSPAHAVLFLRADAHISPRRHQIEEQALRRLIES